MADGRTRRLVRSFFGAPLAALGTSVVLAYLGIAAAAPWLVPHDPLAQDLSSALSPPDRTHPFGTDSLGRDLLSRVIAAARVDLTITAGGTGIAAAIAVSVGLASAYIGGPADRVVSAAADSALTFPTLLLAVVLVNLAGNSLGTVIAAVAATATPALLRVVRSTVLQTATLEFIDAARATGAGPMRIVYRHLLPNIMGQAAVYTTLLASQAVLTVTALGFLGLGVQPPTPEWGAMLARSRTYLHAAPFVMLFPGLAIGGLVLGLNLLGDALQDAFDPRGRLGRAAF
jgi:peptide/nickel transport system permease protein